MKRLICFALIFILISAYAPSFAQSNQEYLVKLKKGTELTLSETIVLEPIAVE